MLYTLDAKGAMPVAVGAEMHMQSPGRRATQVEVGAKT